MAGKIYRVTRRDSGESLQLDVHRQALARFLGVHHFFGDPRAVEFLDHIVDAEIHADPHLGQHFGSDRHLIGHVCGGPWRPLTGTPAIYDASGGRHRPNPTGTR